MGDGFDRVDLIAQRIVIAVNPFEGVPPPWDTILTLIIGPVGAVVVMGVIIYFLWRLFREEQMRNRKNVDTVSTLTQTIKDLTTEVRAWREAAR